MAGSYPDVPSRRMAIDADGTIGLWGTLTQPLNEYTPTQMTHLNSEEGANLGVDGGDVNIFLFAELREFDGIMVGKHDPDVEVESSGDTTNGQDGSWSQVIASHTVTDTPYADYRDNIESTNVPNVRGVRLNGSFSNPAGSANDEIRNCHIYGEISAGETPDRLLWVDNDTGSEFGLPIDYGDIPRGSAEDTEVKLRNNSGSLTASSVQITAEALYLDSGAWYTFKEAGGSFQATLPLASAIGAGSDSPVITIRRVVPDDAQTGLHAARASVAVGSWS